MEVARRTHERIKALAKERPLVYLPSHDGDGERRLRENSCLPAKENLEQREIVRASAINRAEA